MPTEPQRGDTSHLPILEMSDSLEALLGESDTRIGGVYLLSVTVLMAALVVSATAPIDVDIRGPATLRPAQERQTLRAQMDGAVATVGVARGQLVHRGDTIVQLRSTVSDRALETATSATREQQALARDLSAMLATGILGDSLAAASVGNLALPRSRAALSEASAEWRQLTADVDQAKHVASRSALLARRGFAAPAELAAAELELTRAREGRALAVERRRAEWSRALADAEQRLRELRRTTAGVELDRANQAIVAPITGTVEELAAVTPASVVRAGDVIATISPDTTLVAEALISPRDVGWIRPGMTTRLLIDGYGVQEWGAAQAVVVSVARDYSVVDGQAVFHVRARLRRAELRRPDGRTARLTKGLRAEARFVVDRRTIGQLLLRRGHDWVDGTHQSEATTQPEAMSH